MTDEPRRAYGFKDVVGSVKATVLQGDKEANNRREPIKVEFSYHDADGKLWLVEALGYREPGIVVNVSLEANRAQAFDPNMLIVTKPCAVCGERTSVYCLQCAAGTTAMTHVCLRDTCQRAHARNRHNAAGMATGEWTRSDSVAPPEEVPAAPTDKIGDGQCCICAALTEFACSDCQIYTEHGVYVCNYGTCQRAHECAHKETSEDV